MLSSIEPDVVALQELDVGRHRSGRGHQPEAIAARLGMNFLFCPTVRDGDEHYGHAILSRHPLRLVQSEELPRSTLPRPAEPRSAIWASISAPHSEVQVIGTHLGLSPIERTRQASALLGPKWMGHREYRGPRVLCGDFNAGPFSLTYRRLRGRMRDAHRSVAGILARPSYPSRLPVMRLDHIFVSDEVGVEGARVVCSPLARIASDHLPLVVDIAVLQPELHAARETER